MNKKKRGTYRAKGKWSTVNGIYGKSHVIKLYGKKDRKEKPSCTNSVG